MGALTDHLPPVRGRLIEGQALGAVTWFRVGGPADVLFMPADPDDLAAFLAALPQTVPVTVIGVGSNLLVRDGGIDGVVIRLGAPFAAIEGAGRSRLRVGAGALDGAVARAARDRSLGGLEFLSGIPGSIGGALRMNAGAYGRETKDILVEAVALDRAGRRHVIPCADMGFAYRQSDAGDAFVFIEALVEGVSDSPEAIEARMAEIAESRAATQPIKSRTGGSTFKNPEGEKAWKLIDAAGCRGLTRGDAQVSALHCNFLINRGAATAADLEGLGEEVRHRVAKTSGITLAWEIKRLGRTP
ncbi:MAG: UDP-N-acetylmuramate dehydrogenase [Alphaproteobacteria bacterium]